MTDEQIRFNKCFNEAYNEFLESTDTVKYNKNYYHSACNKRLFNKYKNHSKTVIKEIILSVILKINGSKTNKNNNSNKRKANKPRNTKPKEVLLLFDDVKTITKEYSSVKDFAEKNRKLYKHCYENNLLKSICEENNWDLHIHDTFQGYIYYIKIIVTDKIYYKLGSSKDVFNRLYDLTKDINDIKISVLKVWAFKTYTLACITERKFHRKFSHKRNKDLSLNILTSGNTELYFEDILGLDVII